MRYQEIVATPDPNPQRRLSTATLYVLPHEWDRLEILLHPHGPTTMTGKWALAPRFPGHSVDVECSSPEVASKLLGAWTKGSGRN